MIVSFGDAATEDLYHGRHTSWVRQLPNDVVAVVLRKLDMLRAANQLLNLRSLPGNRLEAVCGTYAGYHSIRVNDQWRIVFHWESDGVHEVSLLDYHP